MNPHALRHWILSPRNPSHYSVAIDYDHALSGFSPIPQFVENTDSADRDRSYSHNLSHSKIAIFAATLRISHPVRVENTLSLLVNSGSVAEVWMRMWTLIGIQKCENRGNFASIKSM